MKHKLCFDYLSRGRVRSGSPWKVSCDVYGAFHPRVLHQPSIKSVIEGVSVASGDSNNVLVSASASAAHSVSFTSTTAVSSAAIAISQTDSSTMPILPVKVRLVSSNQDVFTYAFLDSGSSNKRTSWRSCRFVERSWPFVLWLNADSAYIAITVSNLEVCGLNKDSYVSLPIVFTQDSQPVSMEQIPQQEHVNHWPYLSHIPWPLAEPVVGILIGGNVH